MGFLRSSKPGIGGLGAVFFVGTLAAIAFYVQGQTVGQHAVPKKPIALTAQTAPPEEQPHSLPWQDRLALGEIALSTQTRPAAAEPAAAGTTATQEPTEPDPAASRYVQALNDGHRILFTLDPVMQNAVLQIFRNREVPYAAAVALDLRDNSVLVLAGHSSMDPTVDALEVVTTPWAPAASVFKLVTAAALLDRGLATATTKACFHGGLHGIEDDELRDDSARDVRCETLSAAIAHSYNLVIGKLALKHLDRDSLQQTAQTVLFGESIPFEFAVEPSPAHFPNDPIERAKVAAGFWNVDLSPVHAAVLASIFARDGVYQPPHVVSQVLDPEGKDITPDAATPRRIMAKSVAAAIAEMMLGTTTHGTARASFRDKHGNDYITTGEVAGKTGSLTGKRAPGFNYNWFVGFAPADRPEIAFAVVLANEPKWRIKAHYAARRLVEFYFERRSDIERLREARLSEHGFVLPQRDASGALVSAGKPNVAGPQASAPAPESIGNAAPEPTRPLPPVPGPVGVPPS